MTLHETIIKSQNTWNRLCLDRKRTSAYTSASSANTTIKNSSTAAYANLIESAFIFWKELRAEPHLEQSPPGLLHWQVVLLWENSVTGAYSRLKPSMPHIAASYNVQLRERCFPCAHAAATCSLLSRPYVSSYDIIILLCVHVGNLSTMLNNKAKETIHMTTIYDIWEKVATTQATSPTNVNRMKTQAMKTLDARKIESHHITLHSMGKMSLTRGTGNTQDQLPILPNNGASG